MSYYLVWVANLTGWPILHVSIAAAVHQIPDRLFSEESWIYRARAWERGGRFYAERLAVRRWKRSLPDGAAWIGIGFPKKILASRNPAYLHRFVVETRRAEFSHWCMLCCAPIFYVWNPFWACAVMTAYAAAANLPCILAQRYNRLTLLRVLSSKTAEDDINGNVKSCRQLPETQKVVKDL